MHWNGLNSKEPAGLYCSGKLFWKKNWLTEISDPPGTIISSNILSTITRRNSKSIDSPTDRDNDIGI